MNVKSLLILLSFIALLQCAGRDVRYHFNEHGPEVSTGLEVFLDNYASRYKGQRAALVTNHSGVDSSLKPNYVLLQQAGINIKMLFAPEHGIYGSMEDFDRTSAHIDPHTGLPVINLLKIGPQDFRQYVSECDIVIFDIQDMGMRCYTYVSNLKLVMDALNGTDIELIVLDRPNPLGPLPIDGPTLTPAFSKPMISEFPATFIYNLTIAEAARYYKKTSSIKIDLSIIPMKGYERSMSWFETGLPWVPPSPNLPTYESSIVYTSVVLFEGMNISIGRGTAKPFEFIGAPWIDHRKMADDLNSMNIRGFVFRPVIFEPKYSKYQNQQCRGVQIFRTGEKFLPTEAAFLIARYLRRTYPDYCYWEARDGAYWTDSLFGSDMFRRTVESGDPFMVLHRFMKHSRKQYLEKRDDILIY